MLQEIPKRWFAGRIHSHPSEQTVQLKSISLDPVSSLNNELYPYVEKKKGGGSIAQAYQWPLAAECALARGVYEELLLFLSVMFPGCCKYLR